MNIEYKFWYIRRDDAENIIECAVRFHEGEYKQKDGKTYFDRIKKLKKEDMPYMYKDTQYDGNNNPYYIFTTEDFGSIKTDQEIMNFFNNFIDQDQQRIPINEQKK